MVGTCYSCKWRSDKLPKRTFHKFPANKEQEKKWLAIIGKTDFNIGKGASLCSAHFEDDCFKYTPVHGRKVLKEGSLPTLLLPFKEKEEPVNMVVEVKLELEPHCYDSPDEEEVEEVEEQNPLIEEINIKIEPMDEWYTHPEEVPEEVPIEYAPKTPKKRKKMSNGAEGESSMNATAQKKMRKRDRHFGSDDEENEDRSPGDDDDTGLMVPRTLRHLFDPDEDDDAPRAEPRRSDGTYAPTDLFEFHWKPNPKPPIAPHLRREKFTQTRSLTYPLSNPYDAFTAIWDRPIMEHIARETNRYADQTIEKSMEKDTLARKSRVNLWKPTNVDELYTYFAISIAIGVVIKSDMQEFWKKDDTIFQTPGFNIAMSRNRFLLLDKFLHFNNNDFLDLNVSRAEAKVFKIAPIVEHLNERFPQLYQLGQNICLDESLTQWKGFRLKQSTQNKNFNSIKSLELCDSQSGYLYKFDLITGSDEMQTPVMPVALTHPIPTVLRLLNGMEHRGHCVWMDSYYSSPALARILKTHGFDCVGTLKTNRQFVPREMNEKKKLPLQKAQIFGCTTGDVDVVVCKDTKNVAFVSTFHGTNIGYCHFDQTRKPIVIRDFNVCMSGMDRKDQQLSIFPIERKMTRIWYKKFFRRLLNASILNAYIIFRESLSTEAQRGRQTHRIFRQALVKLLLSLHHKRAESPSPVLTPLFTTEQVRHFTVPYPDGSLEQGAVACTLCESPVNTYCPECNVPLCLAPCAQDYHLQDMFQILE